jgi:DNA-directed RNA polymerase alpha subunit
LPTRSYNSLIKGGINTIDQLIILTKKELHRYPEMGSKGIEKINQALKERFGLSLELTQYKK